MNLPQLNNAYTNVKDACLRKLEELYEKGIPKDISSRLTKELLFFKASNYIDDFELFRLFSQEAKKSASTLRTRGTLTGSLIYYLLSNSSFSPLAPHYYCMECGYYEVVNTSLFGIDLPVKKCPHCNHSMQPDGYNLPLESVWGTDGKEMLSFEYNINTDFLPFARRILQSAYPDNAIVPWGMFEISPDAQDAHTDTHAIGVRLTGYIVMPTGNTLDDYPDLISYLENGDTCITGGTWELMKHMLKPIKLFNREFLDELIKLQRETGIYVNELSTKELSDITWRQIYNTGIINQTTRMLFHEYKPRSYKDMVALDASSHNSFSWQAPEHSSFDTQKFKKMISTDYFKKYPCFTREDFFDYLVLIGTDRTLAFEASEKIRKGHANSSNSRYHHEFEELPIPEDIKKIAQNYLYIFPRAHEIQYLLDCARLAYYAREDSRVFSKIVFKKKSH